MPQSENMHDHAQALICIGDRPVNPAAMTFSATLLDKLQLTPVLFHVAPEKATPSQTDSIVAAVHSTLGRQDVEVKIVHGNPRDEILRELERGSYQLLVLGTSIREAHLPSSPLSRDLAGRAGISVLIIRNPPQEIREILICTAGHPASLNVVTWGLHLAQTSKARATVLYIASSPPAMYTGLPALEEGLAQVLARDNPLSKHLKETAALAHEAGVEASLEYRHGMVTEEILRACEMITYDLVVVGAPQPRQRIEPLLLGSVIPELLASSNLSTVIVRNHQSPPGR